MTYTQQKEDLLKNAGSLVKQLVSATEEIHESKKTDNEVSDKKIVEELKKLADMKTNAPTDSSTAGAAAEIYPGVITMENVLRDDNLSADYAWLNALAGENRFSELQKGDNHDLPVITEPGMVRGITEWSAGTIAKGAGFNNLNTAKVNIQTKQLGNAVDISAYLEKFGVVSALQTIRSQDADAYAYSIGMSVLNGDTEAAATGNINSDDQLAVTTYPNTADGYLDMRRYFDNSLRKKAIAAGNTVDIGAPAGVDDIFDVAKLLKSRGAANPASRFIVMEPSTYWEYMKQDDFKDFSKNGASSTITKGAITNIAGMDLFVSNLYALAEADGKLSGATPAGNTLGGFAVIARDTIPHGWNAQIETAIDVNLLKGTQYQSTGRFGFGNMDQINGTKVALGRNITV